MIGIFGAGEEGYGEGSAIPHGDSTYIMTKEHVKSNIVLEGSWSRGITPSTLPSSACVICVVFEKQDL